MIDLLLEKNLLPDPVLRFGIRRLLRQRLRDERARSATDEDQHLMKFADQLRVLPTAINTEESKAQHYEVPTKFYQHVLGPRLKYSCAWFERGDETLAEAEENMLRLYESRGDLCDGQDVLELGCGWGSFTLWLAERFPHSRVTGVSHSRSQKEYIDAVAARKGLRNVTIITADMNDFSTEAARYDRIVSVEMFEHMKNWPRLFESISRWLKPEGRFFLHIFTHRKFAYHFEARDSTDWMSRYFFTGGMMPAEKLPALLSEDLRVERQWTVDGRHYQQTAEHWLRNMDAARAELMPLMARTYGAPDAEKWWSYWRIFFLSCSELWGFRNGSEWTVSHYQLRKVHHG